MAEKDNSKEYKHESIHGDPSAEQSMAGLQFFTESDEFTDLGHREQFENKKGTIYIVETVLDTKTGKVITRRKKKASSYKLPYKNKHRKTIYEE